jgi:hypothetical protein
MLYYFFGGYHIDACKLLPCMLVAGKFQDAVNLDRNEASNDTFGRL